MSNTGHSRDISRYQTSRDYRQRDDTIACQSVLRAIPISDINAKFRTKKRDHVQSQFRWPKYQISEMQDGGRLPFWKKVLSLYLSQQSFDFNEIWWADAHFPSKDGHVTKNQNFANSKWRTAATLKIILRLTRNLAWRSIITLWDFRLSLHGTVSRRMHVHVIVSEFFTTWCGHYYIFKPNGRRKIPTVRRISTGTLNTG